jgi:hypothetical protein
LIAQNPELRIQNSELRTSAIVTVVVALLTLGLIGWLWGHYQGDPEGFIHQGTVWLDPVTRQGSNGYDGQFYYYIAKYPRNSVQFLDLPSIRLQRIFYPLLIFVGSLGIRALMPYTMIAINWLAVVAGTWGVARWLAIHRRSPWFALCYALSSGIPVALGFDTPEPLAFALVIGAVHLWHRARPAETDGDLRPDSALSGAIAPSYPAADAAPDTQHATRYTLTFHVSRFTFHVPTLALAGGLLALALLTREHTIYFVLAFAGAALLRRDWRGLATAVLAFVPVTLWGLILSLTLGKSSVSQLPALESIPFITYWVQGNLVDPTPRSAGYALQYIIPTAVFGLIALGGLLAAPLRWLRSRQWNPPAALLLAVLGGCHLMAFVPKQGYQHQVAVSRYMLGLTLAAVLWAATTRPRWLLWLTPLFLLSLLAYAYGLITLDPAYLW